MERRKFSFTVCVVSLHSQNSEHFSYCSPIQTPRIHAPTVGKVLLKSRGFFTDDYMFWVCVGALLGFSLLFNILFIAALTFLNRKLSHLVIWFRYFYLKMDFPRWKYISRLNNPVSGCSTSALSDSKSIVLDEDVGKKNKKSSGRMTSEGLSLYLCLFWSLLNDLVFYFSITSYSFITFLFHFKVHGKLNCIVCVMMSMKWGNQIS